MYQKQISDAGAKSNHYGSNSAKLILAAEAQVQNGGQIVRHTIVLLKNRAPLGGSEFYAFSNNNEKINCNSKFHPNCRKVVRRSFECFRSFRKISEDYRMFPIRNLKMFRLYTYTKDNRFIHHSNKLKEKTFTSVVSSVYTQCKDAILSVRVILVIAFNLC